ncbi:MAG: hypothetical protein JST42_13260 [Bacteroidetes bacterium]|nr:hypothetical protein [Bacteroidota bacterium]
MLSMIREELVGLSASALRFLLISEIQEFIRSLENGLPLDQLVRKRDYIKELLGLVSNKELIEFEAMLGNYFPHNK